MVFGSPILAIGAVLQRIIPTLDSRHSPYIMESISSPLLSSNRDHVKDECVGAAEKSKRASSSNPRGLEERHLVVVLVLVPAQTPSV